MKTSIKFFFCALALVATALTSHAQDSNGKKSSGLGTSIYYTKSGKINLTVEKPNSDAAVSIKLTNLKGDVFYSEKVSKSNQKFGRILDVEALQAGKYRIQISSNGETQFKSFEVSIPSNERVVAIQ